MTYNTTRRKPLRGKAREAFLDAHGRRCYYCGEPILAGQKWHDEHLLARELGGSDEMSNRRPIHAAPCHKAKTAADRKLIAKSNHVRRFHGVDPDNRKPKPKMKSRGLPKGAKRTWPTRAFPKRRA